MCPSGETSLHVDCFSEHYTNLSMWSITKWTSSSSHRTVTYPRHDIDGVKQQLLTHYNISTHYEILEYNILYTLICFNARVRIRLKLRPQKQLLYI